jgi:hypothetical protein
VVVAATAPAAAFCGHPRRRLPAVVVTAAATSRALAVAAAAATAATANSRRSTTGNSKLRTSILLGGWTWRCWQVAATPSCGSVTGL